MKARRHHFLSSSAACALLACTTGFFSCHSAQSGPKEKKEEDGLPRPFALSPEESQKAWRIDGDFELQIAAAEPVVTDPVDVV